MDEHNGDWRGNSAVTLTRLFDACLPTDPLAQYQERIRNWVATYLVAPHPELGRDGAVCPFTASSIKEQSFWVGCDARQDLTARDVEATIFDVISVFHNLPPTAGAGMLLKTVVVVFPTVTEYGFIDEAQRYLKDKSVTMGLMVGQFYPGCEEPGIRNQDFRPLQSPVALLAIRYMMSSDYPFLFKKPEWLVEYLRKFGPKISKVPK